MRKDPPFDSEYFYATHLLEQAEREGARVFNKPAACATTRKSWPSWSSRSTSAPRWSRASADEMRRFHAEHKDIILKPLDGMGGMGIFRVKLRWAEPRRHHRDAEQGRRRERDGAALCA
jgi:glutathione synthase